MKTSIIIVILSIILASLYLFCTRYWMNIYVEDKDFETMRTMEKMAEIIEMMATTGEYKYPIGSNDLRDYLKTNEDAQIFVRSKIRGEAICDEWGGPISFTSLKPTIYMFHSFGSNKKDDNGKGDDIVQEVNIGNR